MCPQLHCYLMNSGKGQPGSRAAASDGDEALGRQHYPPGGVERKLFNYMVVGESVLPVEYNENNLKNG